MTSTAPDRAGAPPLAAALARSIEAQTELMDQLVGATQDQIRALIGLRVHADGGEELATSQSEVQRLVRQLEQVSFETRRYAVACGQALGLPSAVPTLTEIAMAMPLPERTAALDRASALRAVTQTLTELQIIAQAHAQRGLQAVAAWRSVIGVPDTGAGSTYTRRGRARAQHTTPVPPLRLEMDL